MKKLLVIALFLGILFNSHAQQFMTVKGQIIDKDEEKGVPYAQVKINNSFAYANIDGFFYCSNNRRKCFI